MQETGEEGAMPTARTAKSATSNMQLPPEVLEGIYTTMQRIRRFDEYTHQLFEELSLIHI